MEYIQNHTSEIGSVLILFIAIFFLFRLGIRLSQNNLRGATVWAWLAVVFFTFTGLDWLQQKNPAGFLGFIPIITYIFLFLINSVDFSYSTKKKVQGIIFSGVASAATYAITHTAFGFGISEASISAFIAASILGAVGYNA